MQTQQIKWRKALKHTANGWKDAESGRAASQGHTKLMRKKTVLKVKPRALAQQHDCAVLPGDKSPSFSKNLIAY